MTDPAALAASLSETTAKLEDLRRHHRALHEQMDQAKQARERLTAILGLSHIPSWQDLPAEVERRVGEDAATIERLRGQLVEMTMAAQMDEVRLPEYPEVSGRD